MITAPERTSLTQPPTGPTSRSRPRAGQIQPVQVGSRSAGRESSATSVSAPAAASHGRAIRTDWREAQAEPSANPRKKQPKTRAAEPPLAPNRSIKRRVHNNS